MVGFGLKQGSTELLNCELITLQLQYVEMDRLVGLKERFRIINAIHCIKY